MSEDFRTLLKRVAFVGLCLAAAFVVLVVSSALIYGSLWSKLNLRFWLIGSWIAAPFLA